MAEAFLGPKVVNVRKRCYEVPIHAFPVRPFSSQKPVDFSSYSPNSILELSPGFSSFRQCVSQSAEQHNTDALPVRL